MATFAATYVPGAAQATATTVASTTAVSITLGTNRLFAIQASGSYTIAFFNSASTSPATAGATDWPQVASQIAEYDTGSAYNSISVYNPGGSSITVWTLPLARI
jgi:hypothetical protein